MAAYLVGCHVHVHSETAVSLRTPHAAAHITPRCCRLALGSND